MQSVIIVCDDLFGLEVYSIVEATNQWYEKNEGSQKYLIKGFLSESGAPFGEWESPAPVFSPMSGWKPEDGVKLIMGILSPEKKAEAVALLKSRGAVFETVYAPWILAFPKWLTIGEGCIVCPYSAKPGMVIGDFVTIDHTMLSGHKLGDYSTTMRLSNIAGDSVGSYSFVGDHCFLAVGKNIGDHCYVESGSIVVKDVKNGTRVSGVPAKKQAAPKA